MGDSIPQRWQPYSKKGGVISGTRIFACKVPLREAICRNLPPPDRFTPKDLLEMEPKLCLVVDLTNTVRYYDKAEFESKNVLHEKIFCPGKMVPPEHVKKRFFSVLDSFLKENPEGLIAVHCTHGVNRTGYLICRYLIDRLQVNPKKAIDDFRLARGHAIERQEYVSVLLDGRLQGMPPSEADLPPSFVTRGYRGHRHHPYGRERRVDDGGHRHHPYVGEHRVDEGGLRHHPYGGEHRVDEGGQRHHPYGGEYRVDEGAGRYRGHQQDRLHPRTPPPPSRNWRGGDRSNGPPPGYSQGYRNYDDLPGSRHGASTRGYGPQSWSRERGPVWPGRPGPAPRVAGRQSRYEQFHRMRAAEEDADQHPHPQPTKRMRVDSGKKL